MDINKKLNEAIEALKNEKFEKTISICEDIISVSKNDSNVYNVCGLAFQKKKLYKESIDYLNKAIETNPNNFQAYNNLAISLKYTKRLDLAEEIYLKCLKINPNFVNGLVNLAKIKVEKKFYNEAIELLLKANRNSPDVNKVFVLSQLSHVYSIIGKFNEAKIYAEEILKIDSFNIFAIKLISDLTDHKESLNMIYKMESMINSSNITKPGISLLAFHLGKAYEQRSDFNKAYEYFILGNEVKKKLTKSFLPQISLIKDDLMNYFKNFKFESLSENKEDRKVIFIIGLPRSGTTLIEQIISSHRNVYATGEIQILKNIIHQNFYKDNILNQNKFSDHIKSKENILYEQYFQNLNKKNINSKIITDKSIENFLYLGFIKLYFPNSKIIIVKRNKEDTFLSIFQTDFQSPFMNWTYDKNEIIKYMEIYSELINFWKGLLPNDFYTVEYEKILDNSDSEIRSLINFCDLKWDSKCLEPEKNSSGIETASIFQARKPIYKSSRNKSKKYSEYLKDVFPLFES